MKIKCFLATVVLATVFSFGAVANAQTAVAEQCHNFKINLGYENSGNSEVGYLHSALQKEGFSYAPDTGNKYAAPTAVAVSQFQLKYGITQTGYFGDITRSKLNTLYGCGNIVVFSPNGRPNGTEKPVAGSNMDVSWGTSGEASKIDSVEIYLVDFKNKAVKGFGGKGYANSAGKMTLLIPEDIARGDYKIKIVAGDYSDTSDGFFTVLSSSEAGYNSCRLDDLKGANIAKDTTTVKEDCLSKVCDAYGPANLKNGTLSKCIFNNSVIKKYVVADGWCFTFDEDLYYYSSKSKQIKALQIALTNEGFYDGAIDGVFGTSVYKAVWNFQKKNNIGANGRFGPTTRVKMNSLYGCKETKPSITVTSPNGGETWQIGQTYKVTWNAVAVDSDVYVSIRNGTTGKVTSSVTKVPAKDGSFSFTINSTEYDVGDKYKVTVGYGEGENKVSDSSDNYFSIVAAASSVDSTSASSSTAGSSVGSSSSVSSGSSNIATTSSLPTIKLTSPNGGEAWQNGQNHSITFTYSGANRGKVYLYLINDAISDPSNQYKTIPIENGYGYAIYDISLSNGAYSWTIPSDQYKYSPGSKYKIKAYWYAFSNDGASLGSFSDISDNYFSISAAGTPAPVTPPAPATTCTPSWTYTAWSTCVNSQQTRTVTDINNCGVTTGKPSESQSCTTAPVTATCTDTDGGKDYFVRGAVKDTKYPNAYTGDGLYTDLCYTSLKQIFEYYCDASSGRSQGEWHACPYGCSNGACNKTAALAPTNIKKEDMVASIYSVITKISEQIAGLLSAGQQ